jgi:DNA-directed RNA polymerase specialized sigma subunit
MNEIEATEIKTLLKNYRSIRSSVEIELNRDYPEYSLGSTSFVKVGGKTNSIISEVENYVISKYSLPERLVKKIQGCEIIKSAYESLTHIEKIIVSEKYFEGKSHEKVAELVNMHKTTVIHKIDEEILPALNAVGILAAWDLLQEGDVYY